MTVITQEEVDKALAHFGVKGMKWGVRKEKTSSTSSGRMSPRTKKVLKTTAKVAAVAAVTAGAAFAGKQLGAQGKFTLSEMNTYAARHSGDVAARFIKDKVDFEVALSQIRNVEAGHYNRLGLGPLMDVRRLGL